MFRSAINEMERQFAAATFVECYEWLDVYVQAEICPPYAKSNLMQRFFDGIEVPYELLNGLNIWPKHVIEGALSRTDGGRPKLINPSTFRSPLQLCASMAADLAFSSAERAFVSLLFFSKKPYWDSFLKEPLRPDAFAWALSGNADPWLDGNRSLAYAGLVRTLEHMKGLSSVLQELQANQPLDDWVNFRESIAAAHSWRLDPPRKDAQDRFSAIVILVDDLIAEGLKRDDPVPLQVNFKDDTRAILALWRSITGPTGKAAGGRGAA